MLGRGWGILTIGSLREGGKVSSDDWQFAGREGVWYQPSKAVSAGGGDRVPTDHWQYAGEWVG